MNKSTTLVLAVLLLFVLSLGVCFAQSKQATLTPTSFRAKPASSLNRMPAKKVNAVSPTKPATAKPVSATTTTQVAKPVSASIAPSAPSSPVTPVQASGFFGSSPLQALFNRAIREDTSLHKPPVGKLGFGISAFMGGSVTAGLIIKQPLYYLSMGAGMVASNRAIEPKNDLMIYGGGGVALKTHVKVGAILTVTMLSSKSVLYNAGTQSVDVKSTTTPTIGFGLQGTLEMRHVWLTATIHKQMGLGIEPTYVA